MAWRTAGGTPNTVACAGVPRPGETSGAVLGGKQGLCLASVLFFLIRPSELHFTSAKNVLLLCLPEFWSLCMGVDDPGQQLTCVPLPGSLDEHPGMLMFGMGADRGWLLGCLPILMPLGELAAILLKRMGFCRELGKGRENRRWLWLRRKSD